MRRDCTWKLLLVEDDADSAEALMSLFGLHGVETLWAIDGLSALQALDSIQRLGERGPDFALLDVSLPGTDTIELGRDLRDHAIGCPVVMISASSEQILRQSAREARAIAALRKPFKIDHLLEILERYVAAESIKPSATRR
jgi:DNA-binding response OmpR family regulator